MMLVVCVTFSIKPGAMDAFLPLMKQQASESLSKEPACRQFDICRSDERPDEIFLYELYDDRAAFQLHLASDHFQSFDLAVGDMVAGKEVKLHELIGGTQAPRVS